MKKNTSHIYKFLTFFAVFFAITTSSAQVGIGTVTPQETLHVIGNARVDGAIMPNGAAGGVDQMLLSQGTGTSPVWGPGFINTSQITNIAKWYIGPLPDILDGFYYTFNVTDASMTADANISVSFIGALPSPGPAWGFDFTVLAEPQNGQFVLHIVNVSGYDISNLSLSFIVYYH